MTNEEGNYNVTNTFSRLVERIICIKNSHREIFFSFLRRKLMTKRDVEMSLLLKFNTFKIIRNVC